MVSSVSYRMDIQLCLCGVSNTGLQNWCVNSIQVGLRTPRSMPQGSCDWWYATVIMGLVVCHSDHGIGSMPQGSWDW